MSVTVAVKVGASGTSKEEVLEEGTSWLVDAGHLTVYKGSWTGMDKGPEALATYAAGDWRSVVSS